MKQFKRDGFSRFLKNLVVLSAVALISVSCGKDNSSGKGSSTDGYGSGIYNYAGYGTQYGNYTLQEMMNIISQENPCAQGGTRVRVQIPLNINVNVGTPYVGVTSFGDMAVVQNQGQAVFEMYICPRSGANGQGQLISNPVIESSTYCAIGQITAANAVLYGATNYQLAFRSIQYGNGSQLCRGNY